MDWEKLFREYLIISYNVESNNFKGVFLKGSTGKGSSEPATPTGPSQSSQAGGCPDLKSTCQRQTS